LKITFNSKALFNPLRSKNRSMIEVKTEARRGLTVVWSEMVSPARVTPPIFRLVLAAQLAAVEKTVPEDSKRSARGAVPRNRAAA
jgi:hypothetical protein